VEAPASRPFGRSAGSYAGIPTERRGAPPIVEAEGAERRSDPAVYHRPEEGWTLWVPCEGCGGHRLRLGPTLREAERLALTRAEAFLLYVRGRFCLGCRAKAWREDPFRPLDGESYLWWDAENHEWMAWVPLPELPEGISLPLGVTSFWDKPKAKAAARGIWEAPTPLAIAADAESAPRHTAAAWHDGDEGRWVLWVPCAGCGGVELALSVVERGAVAAACTRALRALTRIEESGCPQCESIDRKAAGRLPDAETRAWYDTGAGEWMLSRALIGSEESLVLPLGVGHFDADRRELFQASLSFIDDDVFLEGDLL
jgi:hypothetical protein